MLLSWKLLSGSQAGIQRRRISNAVYATLYIPRRACGFHQREVRVSHQQLHAETNKEFPHCRYGSGRVRLGFVDLLA